MADSTNSLTRFRISNRFSANQMHDPKNKEVVLLAIISNYQIARKATMTTNITAETAITLSEPGRLIP